MYVFMKVKFSEIKKLAIKFHRSIPNVRNPALNSIRLYDARIVRAKTRPRNILIRDNDFVPPVEKRRRRLVGVT